MGSQFIDIYVADPAEAHAAVRGERPALFAKIFAGEDPPSAEQRRAFEVMEQSTFCFLAKGRTRADGIHYCRAFERILKAIDGKRWGIECYPDESAYMLWDLAFGDCEAEWLTLPHSDSGVAVIAWRSPRAAYSIGARAKGMHDSGEYERRYVSPETLLEIHEACMQGYRSEFGIFTIYQA